MQSFETGKCRTLIRPAALASVFAALLLCFFGFFSRELSFAVLQEMLRFVLAHEKRATRREHEGIRRALPSDRPLARGAAR